MIDVEQHLREWREAGLVRVTRRYQGRELPTGVYMVHVIERPKDESIERGAIERVFEHWQREHDHPQAKLTPDRRRLIAARLKTFAEPVLLECISGYKRSPHHMGENKQGRRYDDIELFLRDAKHVETGVQLARQRGGAPLRSREDPQATMEFDPEVERQKFIARMREYYKDPTWEPPPVEPGERDIGKVLSRLVQRVPA